MLSSSSSSSKRRGNMMTVGKKNNILLSSLKSPLTFSSTTTTMAANSVSARNAKRILQGTHERSHQSKNKQRYNNKNLRHAHVTPDDKQQSEKITSKISSNVSTHLYRKTRNSTSTAGNSSNLCNLKSTILSSHRRRRRMKERMTSVATSGIDNNSLKGDEDASVVSKTDSTILDNDNLTATAKTSHYDVSDKEQKSEPTNNSSCRISFSQPTNYQNESQQPTPSQTQQGLLSFSSKVLQEMIENQRMLITEKRTQLLNFFSSQTLLAKQKTQQMELDTQVFLDSQKKAFVEKQEEQLEIHQKELTQRSLGIKQDIHKLQQQIQSDFSRQQEEINQVAFQNIERLKSHENLLKQKLEKTHQEESERLKQSFENKLLNGDSTQKKLEQSIKQSLLDKFREILEKRVSEILVTQRESVGINSLSSLVPKVGDESKSKSSSSLTEGGKSVKKHTKKKDATVTATVSMKNNNMKKKQVVSKRATRVTTNTNTTTTTTRQTQAQASKTRTTRAQSTADDTTSVQSFTSASSIIIPWANRTRSFLSRLTKNTSKTSNDTESEAIIANKTNDTTRDTAEPKAKTKSDHDTKRSKRTCSATTTPNNRRKKRKRLCDLFKTTPNDESNTKKKKKRNNTTRTTRTTTTIKDYFTPHQDKSENYTEEKTSSLPAKENETSFCSPSSSQVKVTPKTKVSQEQDHIEIGEVGYAFSKYFPGHGFFLGTITEIRQNAMNGKDRRVLYSDGDLEDLTLEEVKRFATTSKLEQVEQECKNKRRGRNKRCSNNKRARSQHGNENNRGKTTANKQEKSEIVVAEVVAEEEAPTIDVIQETKNGDSDDSYINGRQTKRSKKTVNNDTPSTTGIRQQQTSTKDDENKLDVYVNATDTTAATHTSEISKVVDNNRKETTKKASAKTAALTAVHNKQEKKKSLSKYNNTSRIKRTKDLEGLEVEAPTGTPIGHKETKNKDNENDNVFQAPLFPPIDIQKNTLATTSTTKKSKTKVEKRRKKQQEHHHKRRLPRKKIHRKKIIQSGCFELPKTIMVYSQTTQSNGEEAIVSDKNKNNNKNNNESLLQSDDISEIDVDFNTTTPPLSSKPNTSTTNGRPKEHEKKRDKHSDKTSNKIKAITVTTSRIRKSKSVPFGVSSSKKLQKKVTHYGKRRRISTTNKSSVAHARAHPTANTNMDMDCLSFTSGFTFPSKKQIILVTSKKRSNKKS